jgi:hypothetical protein
MLFLLLINNLCFAFPSCQGSLSIQLVVQVTASVGWRQVWVAKVVSDSWEVVDTEMPSIEQCDSLIHNPILPMVSLLMVPSLLRVVSFHGFLDHTKSLNCFGFLAPLNSIDIGFSVS